MCVGGVSCEYELKYLIGSSGQPKNKSALTWDLCVELTASYRKESSVLSNVAKGPV